MITLKILSLPRTRLSSDLHPFYRWKNRFRDYGIDIELVFNHNSKKLRNADRVLLYHRYFDHGMKDALKNASEKDSKLINYLYTLKKDVGKLIWFDADDSSGTTQFPVINYVDTFAKKQILKNTEYYTEKNENKNVNVWLDPELKQKKFLPCPDDQLYKIKVGWNIAYFDHRYFRFQHLLSNYVNYKICPLKYTNVAEKRVLDLSFRGMINYNKQIVTVSQRNTLLKMLNTLNLNVATGEVLPRNEYLGELSQSKVSISPFGFGEICYRDFETFISGSLLIKPSVEHLITFPNLFIPNETYIPVSWDLCDFKEKAEHVVSNYNLYKHIAINGQEVYKRTINDPEVFINAVKHVIM